MSDQVERLLRRLLRDTLDAKEEQGHETGEIRRRLESASGVDALFGLAELARDLPVRDDWPYQEPDDLPTIQVAADRAAVWSDQAVPRPPSDVVRSRIETSFLASVCGCVLGKPVEVQATAAELRAAAAVAGETWPPVDYISARLLDALGRRPADWNRATRDGIDGVPPDDDINLRLLTLVLLEDKGREFAAGDVVSLWLRTLPIDSVFASNRTLLLKAALHWWRPGDPPLGPFPTETWVHVLNPYDEDCGAILRSDPYGYACPGRPGEAAALAWRDASATHRRTGVYAAMFQAAAVASAFTAMDQLDIFTSAIRYVPRQSRFRERMELAINVVMDARDWSSAHDALEVELGSFGHCAIYMELATVINSTRFAADVGTGIGLQVAQGLDTDTFGASLGAILGALHGPGGLDRRWLEPFHDRLLTSIAGFPESSLTMAAARMGDLPRVGPRGLESAYAIG